jgi:tetratricopeptide (TPR) repeat protein
MDAVTYPHQSVVAFVERNLVPLRVASDAQPLASDFAITWTPTIVILDHQGKEHHRTVGFFDAEALIPSLLLGLGKVGYDSNRFKEALGYLEKLLAEFPESDSAPEAIFLTGVSRYKSTSNPLPLKEAYEQLQKTYPASTWTKRAYPYRLIG